MSPRRLTVAVLVALGVTSCAHHNTPKTPAPEIPVNLTGTEWVLQDLSGTPALPNVESTLSFLDGGRVAGRASCNQFSGSYTLTGTSIAFSPLAVTKMACIPGVDEQERRVLAAFENAERIEVDGATLKLYLKGSDQPLRYAKK